MGSGYTRYFGSLLLSLSRLTAIFRFSGNEKIQNQFQLRKEETMMNRGRTFIMPFFKIIIMTATTSRQTGKKACYKTKKHLIICNKTKYISKIIKKSNYSGIIYK